MAAPSGSDVDQGERGRCDHQCVGGIKCGPGEGVGEGNQVWESGVGLPSQERCGKWRNDITQFDSTSLDITNKKIIIKKGHTCSDREI